MGDITTEAIIACPLCGAKHEQVMPTDACQYFYKCSKCNETFKPKDGDCCVYCSYANIKCPPTQMSAQN